MSVSCAICLALGQAIFQLRLKSHLSGVIEQSTVRSLIDSGVNDVSSLVEPGQLGDVLSAFSEALTDVLVSIPVVHRTKLIDSSYQPLAQHWPLSSCWELRGSC